MKSRSTWLTAVFILATAVLCAEEAAPVTVTARSLEQPGAVKVLYNWELTQAIVKGSSGRAVLTLNYPFIISGGNKARLDRAPYIEDGELIITSFAAGEIGKAIGTGPTPTSTTLHVQVQSKEKTPEFTPTIEIEEKPLVIHEKPAATAAPSKEAATPAAKPIPTAAPAATEAIRVEEPRKGSLRKLVVIDPGHGGNDPGAIGPTGLNEKEVTLDVARRIREHLNGYPVDVVISRPTDDFVTLKNRAVFANSRKADLFVSVHCNASPDSQAAGTRSYIYSRVASSKEAAAAAKFENKEIGAFEFLLNDLRKSAYENFSIEAAGNIQHDLVRELKLKWEPTERAPFYVLANTNMPSVLVEIAFISNPKEEQRMKSSDFKEKVSYAIAQGIEQYLEKIK